MRTTGAGQSALLLIDVIEVLNQCHVPYAIIGAFAASFYGMVRASLDADAVISVGAVRDSLKTFLSALEQRNIKCKYHKGDADDPLQGVINVKDVFHNRVDLILGIRGMPKDVFERAIETKFRSARIKIISLEDFIAMKIFAGSVKDLQDVVGVLHVSRNKINHPLLKDIAMGYGKDVLMKLTGLLAQHNPTD